MSELRFSVEGITPDPLALVPMLSARVAITELTGAVVHAMALRCQVRIEPRRRAYGDADGAELTDLFGERHRWSRTLQPFVWLHASTMVSGFSDATTVDLPLACSYDLEVAAGKYLHAIREGEIPLTLCFSGTVFTRGTTGFQVEQLPWDADVEHGLPAQVWRQLMDLHFPGSGWVRLDEGTIDALRRYQARCGWTSMDEAVAELLGGQALVAVDGANGSGGSR